MKKRMSHGYTKASTSGSRAERLPRVSGKNLQHANPGRYFRHKFSHRRNCSSARTRSSWRSQAADHQYAATLAQIDYSLSGVPSLRVGPRSDQAHRRHKLFWRTGKKAFQRLSGRDRSGLVSRDLSFDQNRTLQKHRDGDRIYETRLPACHVCWGDTYRAGRR
jgi:hypothetical protein